MNEEPKSIWKKSWKGRSAILIWCVLIGISIFLAILFAALGKVDTRLGSNFTATVLTGTAIAVCGLFIICAVILLFHWLFWRHWRRTLFALACLATLIALFYAEEDWRGWHAWNKFKHQWEAKGEKFNFADFVPPPVPDNQNFALAPIWVESMKAVLGPKNSRAWFGNKFAENGRTNFTDRLALNIVHNGDWGNAPTNGNWANGTVTDLKVWQAYYRDPAQKNRNSAMATNEFSIASQSQSPAEDVLLALSKYDSVIEEVRQASQLPYSRFPIEYDKENPAMILLPHLASLKKCSQVLQLRTIAELQNGQSDEALADMKLALRLADSVRTEPFIITHLVRIAILQITLQPVWEGLAEHKWSDAQLAELDSELSKLDFLADYEFSTRSERAAHIKAVDWMQQKRSRFWELFNVIDNDYKKMMSHFGLSVEIYLMPKGWYYQSEIVLSKVQQQWVLPMVNDPQQTVSPQAARESVAAVSLLRPNGVNLFARLLLPELGKYAERAAYGQTAANLARVAIALERYRLVHGTYPESLDALAPQFIAKLPHDIINGQPLHYRQTADGQFVLYSVGWNETDDDGEVSFKEDGSVDRDTGDWVWQYPTK
jgi:hypothetical protein